MIRVDREALVVGMMLVPGLCSRNKCFGLFEDAEVRRARARATQLRGIVRQLADARGAVEGLAIVEGELRYRMPGIRLERRAQLTESELSCVKWLAARAGIAALAASDEDRARIDAALRRLGYRSDASS